MNKRGFTILETALAMAFISFLMLAIGFAVIQISNVYEKGITIKVVNNNGRELVDEFSRTIMASKYSKDEDEEKKARFEYTYTQTIGEVSGVGARSEEDDTNVPLHGALCLGNYSYLWNTGYALSLEDNALYNEASVDFDYNDQKGYLLVGEDDPDTTENEIKPVLNYRLIRVADPGREACKGHAENVSEDKDINKYVITASTIENVSELLSASENDLALYDLTVFEPIYHVGTGHALYSASFILGTLGGGVDITVPGNFCTEKPNNLKTDFNYCSINKFNFAARATGGLAI